MSPFEQQIKVPPTKTEREASVFIAEFLKNGARSVGHEFTKPDDDWVPLWMVVQPEGVATFIVGGDVEDEDLQAVALLVRRVGAVAVGMVASTWQVNSDGMSRERADEVFAQIHAQHGDTEGVPERFEAVFVSVLTATIVRGWAATIVRHKNRAPTLKPFKETQAGSWTGRVVEPIRAALIRMG